ncbi:hypothetical protein FACS189494_01510 [Spirochaetia bacterium]|nr:hypothetical protein FACS189494_01510 [Spirochaetia bacterium]
MEMALLNLILGILLIISGSVGLVLKIQDIKERFSREDQIQELIAKSHDIPST